MTLIEQQAQSASTIATRTGVGVFDISLLSTFELVGSDACQVLNWVCTNQMDVPVGRAVYTATCDPQGIFYADLVVVRRSAERFLVVATDTHQDLLRIKLERAAIGFDTAVLDTTGDTAIISVQGPNSRELLSRISTVDLSLEAFPYLYAKTITAAAIELMALRITFTGDCGWELHVSAKDAPRVYSALFQHSEGLGVTPCGMDAIYSLGAEKGYLDGDIHVPTSLNPLEAGLRFTIDWKKEFGFLRLGRATPASRATRSQATRTCAVRTPTVAWRCRAPKRKTRRFSDLGNVWT